MTVAGTDSEHLSGRLREDIKSNRIFLSVKVAVESFMGLRAEKDGFLLRLDDYNLSEKTLEGLVL